MNSIVQHNVQKLINDIGEVKLVLEMLEDHRTLWARSQEERDVSHFMDCISKIEVDISIAVNNFMVKNKNGNRNEAYVIEGMQQAFSYINDLFHDIKNARKDLHRSFIRQDELETLEIDLARFRKNIIQLLNYMEYERPEKINSNN
jgi:hypothetical protein